jgi:3-phenylpropionate/trans-cinnamate dioxygenase ferredoxin subunit
MPKERICPVPELAVGELRRFELGGLPICLVHAEDGNFYAIEDRCTHEQTPLSEGWTSGVEIECSRHNSVFDLRTGNATSLPATEPAQVYPVSIEGGYVVIEAPGR